MWFFIFYENEKNCILSRRAGSKKLRIKERRENCMNDKIVLWTALFTIGISLILFRLSLSRYISDAAALFVAGLIFTFVSGIGLLLELYRK